MTEKQLSLSGLPQASYPIRISCGRCGHRADMRVGIEVIHSLYRLRCGECGASGKDLAVEQLFRADLGV